MILKKIVKTLLGDPQKKTLKQLNKRILAINELVDTYETQPVENLRKSIDKLKSQVRNGDKTLDQVLPDTFAIVRAASQHILGMRHFDVQLIGGIVLHEGNIAEMRTGEGKTLVATLPLVLNALEGKGSHLVTVNDYLARRDAGWMAQIYHALGLSTGVIIAQNSFIYDPEYTNEEHQDERLQHLKPVTRREAYAADITYGTNNEFGFDYLRDNMVNSENDLAQRPLHYAIVDEVDSILIDEARTPLIISAPSASSGSQYASFSKAVRNLDESHYELDEKQRAVSLNDDGVQKIQEILGLENLYDSQNVQMIYHLDQALRAETLFKRDRNYVVSNGEVIIVDEFTGRLMHGRRYSEGLHQAIEAKEGVEVLQESMTLATISFQNYFRLYKKLSGMTGTAETEKEEFYTIYKLDVVVIPTNKPTKREDRTDRIYKTEAGKFKSMAKEIKVLQEKGQPVLIGTVSVEKNELVGRLLTKEGVKYEVLNAKNNESEAEIVAKAGQKGAVTLATNIAGRGTDIVLGEGVTDLGGLFVVGTERHESRRIDNQLRGRAGRQGDPGSTQFYVSLEDDLMRIFGGDRIAGLMEKLGVDAETAIENKSVSKALLSAQKKVENHHFDSRKQVVQYDDVMNRQRKATYGKRHEILKSEDVSKDIRHMVKDVITQIVANPPEKDETESSREKLVRELSTVVPISGKERKLLNEVNDDEVLDKILEISTQQYKEREDEFTVELMRKIEREVYLQVLDNLWMQQLEEMQYLREGIGWRSVGQKDPLVEYRREGQKMYEGMLADMYSEIARTIYRVRPRNQLETQELETELTRAAGSASESQMDKDEAGRSKTQQKAKKRADKASDLPKEKPVAAVKTKAKDTVRQKKKNKRQNRKKGRK
ncbi:preprotein translocase subunit SecA [Candidatus Saccharibacteria bacterium]|nr:preprotein translocase subunit SecA [Candidatus Saccharibacteria bacterium]MBP9131779.1 preprotein translocase subunit SecA [Candidatus Saccharibacteria bacterium]